MDKSTEELLAKLERATSADSHEPMDDETAMLRDSWLAFSKLVEAVDAQPSPVGTRPRQMNSIRLVVQCIAALAASLLVAFVTWTALNRKSSDVELQPSIATAPGPSNKASGLAEVSESPKTNEQLSEVDEFAWDDSLDERIASASQAIRNVQADWSNGSARYSVLLDQFEQVSDELSESSL